MIVYLPLPIELRLRHSGRGRKLGGNRKRHVKRVKELLGEQLFRTLRVLLNFTPLIK